MEFREAAMSRQITLEIHNAANDVIGQYQLDAAGKRSISRRLTVPATSSPTLPPASPQNVTTAQQGSDLLVTFDSGSNLIIENYFTQGRAHLLASMPTAG